MKELSLDVVQSQLPAQQRLLVDEATVEEINKLAQNPEYGEQFLQSYLDHLKVLEDSPRNTHDQYLRAVKFFSLVEADHSLTDAYIKVFPERYDARKRHHPDEGKEIMRSEASRYNKSRMVNDIRRIATIPVQLIHRHLLHEAILIQAKLMNTAKSEMVRQKASDTLIRELKPQEDATLNIKVDDNTTSVIDELIRATHELANEQFNAVSAGVPLKHIAQAKIFKRDEDIIDVDSQEINP